MRPDPPGGDRRLPPADGLPAATPPRTRACSASTPTRSQRAPTASWSRSGPAARAVADRGVRLGGRSRAPVVPVDAVRRARRAGPRARHGRCWTAPARGARRPAASRPAPTARSRSRMAVRRRSGWCRGCRSSTSIGRPRPGWAPAAAAGRCDRPARSSRRGGRPRRRRQQAELDALDRELLGFAHPEDHAYDLRERPWLLAYRDESGRLVGYGYTSEVGRIGPIAVTDAEAPAPRSWPSPHGGGAARRVVGLAARRRRWRVAGASGRASGSRASRSSRAGPAVRGLHQIRTNVTGPHLIGPLLRSGTGW